jgi:hypothetical protein
VSAIMASASSSVKGRSSRSPLLDYTRRTQAEAMESRSAKRIESLVLLDHRVMWIPSHRSLERLFLHTVDVLTSDMKNCISSFLRDAMFCNMVFRNG